MLSSSSVSTANENEEDVSIPEGFNTKKVRFKKSDTAPEYVMVVDPPLNTEDYDKILSQGPWVIFGHYLTV
ncbi:hypothetical protein J1N35_004143 [Gossypium stocksii]|uniref:DUF4283 domain-containing protein n=1 Tax=Gossypium stocksii TaxID=47602 RepID=A0A9D3WD26_9ROSI|nr:hypothetical protein J1N35_004143 [Gossypium stocksii]